MAQSQQNGEGLLRARRMQWMQWLNIPSDQVPFGGGGGGTLSIAHVLDNAGELVGLVGGAVGELAVVVNPTPSQGHIWDGSDWLPVGPLMSVAGAPGPAGPAGATPQFVIGAVTTGSPPLVTMSGPTGTPPTYTLNFRLPAGGVSPGAGTWDGAGLVWDEPGKTWE
jgi:hypothetical protein